MSRSPSSVSWPVLLLVLAILLAGAVIGGRWAAQTHATLYVAGMARTVAERAASYDPERDSPLQDDLQAWAYALSTLPAGLAVATQPTGPYQPTPIEGNLADLDGSGPREVSGVSRPDGTVRRLVIKDLRSGAMQELRVNDNTVQYLQPQIAQVAAPAAVAALEGKYVKKEKYVLLDWPPVQNDGGAPIRDYIIHYSAQDSMEQTQVVDAVSAASWAQVRNLKPGTYRFHVRADNGTYVGEEASVEVTVPPAK